MSEQGAAGLGVLILLMAILVGGPMCQGAVIQDDIAIRALTESGYSQIEIVEKDIWWVGFKGGHEDDAVLFQCRALNPANLSVDVDVYVSYWPWSSATIRTR